MAEFKAFPKIGRENPFMVTITEKINGTNACIIVEKDEIVGVQSRKRLITPENDNFGFARWVDENSGELVKLGDGYHYGEWAGEGIQKNHHNLSGKVFFLFNTFRWNPLNPNRPVCTKVVPILFEGIMEPDTIDILLTDMKDNSPEEETPEGIVVYYHALRGYTKHTIIAPNGKWLEKANGTN